MVTRHEVLTAIHDQYQPRNYLEIGVNDGKSLALTRVRSIGVDPAFAITEPFECDVRVVRATSDDFFARKDAIARFPDGIVDFGFIDGMHLFEYALRDFMNLEKLSAWTSVIVLDDMLPRSVPEAARDRHTKAWTGDVFRVLDVLREYRPDLVTFVLDSSPTGVAVVFGADSTNTVLDENYDAIIAKYAMPDPQTVPDEVLRRTIATEPRSLLESDVWSHLVRARTDGVDRAAGIDELRSTLERAARPAPVRAIEPSPVAAASKPAAAAKAAAPAGPQSVVRRVRRRLRPLRKAFREIRTGGR